MITIEFSDGTVIEEKTIQRRFSSYDLSILWKKDTWCKQKKSTRCVDTQKMPEKINGLT